MKTNTSTTVTRDSLWSLSGASVFNRFSGGLNAVNFMFCHVPTNNIAHSVNSYCNGLAETLSIEPSALSYIKLAMINHLQDATAKK